MALDIEKRHSLLQERLAYVRDIFDGKHQEVVDMLEVRLKDFEAQKEGKPLAARTAMLDTLEELFTFMERKLDAELTPMDKVRIVRHPQRICLRDILENVYDNYTEIGGEEDKSIDPGMLIARAYITRRSGKRVYNQAVMVIGQEKGHGEEFRNGGSVKPWGNAKALQYMKVAETENIPIHSYVFTPGAYPIEDYPGAAQQIARNLYEMADLRVPIIAVFSEGGSGGAEAIALADTRLMLSHGYYSVISPEGAAAIESRLRQGERATPETIERCARQFGITAKDNLEFGLIDRIVPEPDLGARPHHYDFFQTLRREVLRATDAVALSVRRFTTLRSMVVKNQKEKLEASYVTDTFVSRWNLSNAAKERLLDKRHEKFAKYSRGKCVDHRTGLQRTLTVLEGTSIEFINALRHDFWRKGKKQLAFAVGEVDGEFRVLVKKILDPVKNLFLKIPLFKPRQVASEHDLTVLSEWRDDDSRDSQWRYVSDRSKEDRAVTCPNARQYGCVDMWAPDLFGDFAGVCSNCGHHFPMEYPWVLHNVFESGSLLEFNQEIEAGTPLAVDGFDVKLAEAKKKTGLDSGCLTFEAKIGETKLIVATFIANFRGGSVGVAEGEKFCLAAERAQRKRYPFLAYVHGTAGIRIQEGTNGVIQMPRCTMAVRRYLDAGGLYLVLYDTNSYAGPVASFLGCSPYQFAVRSSNIGFAGPGVIKETTGMDIPPDYHSCFRALARGHIQGIWDRRQIRANLSQALLTMGGRNLYYR